MANFKIHQDAEKENPHMLPLKEKCVAPSSLILDKENTVLQSSTHSGLAGAAVSLKKRAVLAMLNNGNEDQSEQQHPQQPQQKIKQANKLKDFKNEAAQLKAQSFNKNTPKSITDVLTRISVDRSNSLTNLSQMEEKQSQLASIPRNNGQRFVEVEYQQNILEHFRESEQKHRPNPHYMHRQCDIDHSMRTILVDWLVEVSECFNLDTETLYLCVSYVDRFLSQMSVMRNKLQLLGITSMHIAAKYEEVYPPAMTDYVFITDDSFSKPEIVHMEEIILKILSFDLCTPTAYAYINIYSVMCDMPEQLKQLTLYICELSLLEADPYLRFLPSLISASAIALARHTLGCSIWTPQLQQITNYRLGDMKEVFLLLSKLHNAALTLKQHGIQDKYKTEKFQEVSTIKPLKEINSAQYEQLECEYNALTISLMVDDTKSNNNKESDNTDPPLASNHN